MKRLLRNAPALALLLLAPAAARATVYQPGLWFVHDEKKADVGAGVAGRSDKVPCPGAFMEYTTSYPTNYTNNGGYHESTSFGMSGTNPYDGSSYTWRHETGFGYAGEFFVEKGRTYTFGEWHGTFLRILLDGTQILDGGAWFATENGTYTAAKTGWIPIEVRAGIGTEGGIAGPLSADFGVGFNTEGVTISGRGDKTWGIPPWRRILDPGDCSLLRTVKSETDYMALDSVATDGDGLAVVASFAGVPSAGTLTAFWGGLDGGDRASAWEHSADLGTIAAGTEGSRAFALPGAAGANFVTLRLRNTDYASGPYLQFTATAAVPKDAPTFDLSCTDVGYTSLVFRAVVAQVGTGATALRSAEVQIATDSGFTDVVKRLPLSLSAPGAEILSTAGLSSNTVYYARVAGSNDAGASGSSATLGPIRTLLPTKSVSTIEARDPGLGTVNAAVFGRAR